MDDEFRSVIGYEGLYQVDRGGRVRPDSEVAKAAGCYMAVDGDGMVELVRAGFKKIRKTERLDPHELAAAAFMAPNGKDESYKYERRIKKEANPRPRKRMLLRPNPGPYTVVIKDNPYRQPKPHDPVLKRYSMTVGVSFSKKGQKWTAYYQKNHLGSFATEELAIEALNKAKGL